MAELRNIANELTEFKKKPFNSLSVTKRCLTINETNYNFENGTSWQFNTSSKEFNARDLGYIDADDKQSQGKATDYDLVWTVHSIKNIGWTQR